MIKALLAGMAFAAGLNFVPMAHAQENILRVSSELELLY